MLRKEASPDWAAPLFSKATCGNPRIMRKTNSSASYARMTTPENHPADSVTRGQLRFLLHLSETQKLSRTADVLGLSLSAASRTLEKLRAAFDDPLFTPHARGLKPTDALRRILPELRRTLEQADRHSTRSRPAGGSASLRAVSSRRPSWPTSSHVRPRRLRTS